MSSVVILLLCGEVTKDVVPFSDRDSLRKLATQRAEKQGFRNSNRSACMVKQISS